MIPELKNLPEKINFWLICIFTALFPFLIYSGYIYFQTASRAINTVFLVDIILIIFSLGLIFYNKSEIKLKFDTVGLGLLILFGYTVIASYFGSSFSDSFWSAATRTTGIFYFFHLLVLLYFFVYYLSKEKCRQIILLTFIASAGLFSFLSLFGGEGFGLFGTDQVVNGYLFGNSTFAGMYLFGAFILAFYYINNYVTNQKSWKLIYPVFLLLNPYLINLAGLFKAGEAFSFQNIIGSAQNSFFVSILSIVLIFVFILFSKIKNSSWRKKITVASVLGGLVFVIWFSFSLISHNGLINNLYLKVANQARPIVWDISKKAISEKKFIGWGLDNFEYAFENKYDNRLLEQKNGGEGWFDKAHNIILDNAVELGLIGLIIGVLIGLLIFIRLTINLSSQADRQYLSTALILIYFIGHFIELQTAFDSTISFLPLIIFLALLIATTKDLFKDKHINYTEIFKLISSVVLICLAVASFWFGLLPFLSAQNANSYMRKVGDSVERIKVYPKVFASPIDQDLFIWRSAYDLQRGMFSNPKLLSNPVKIKEFASEFDLITGVMAKAIKDNTKYRTKIELAQIYIFQKFLGVDNLNTAHQVLDLAINDSPKAPQAYWMKSVAYLYQGKFNDAKIYAKKALDLNPNIEESNRLSNYINQAIKDFPEIDLYAFRQI